MPWLHGRTYWCHVHRSDASRVRRPLGTADLPLARDIERMLRHLRERREWAILHAIAAETITAGAVYDAWSEGAEAMRAVAARLADVDLNSLIEGWKSWAARRASPQTVAKYERQLRRIVSAGAPFPASRFTRRELSIALDRLGRSGSTARRHHAAWSSFGNYLVERQVIEANPLRQVRAPKANDPRELYLSPRDVRRLSEVQPRPYDALAALREGAAAELGVALAARVGDIDKRRRLFHARGTKNAWRDRFVQIEEWAWPLILRACGRKALSAALFEGATEERARAAHRRALKTLGLDPGYRMHDARHSYAVMRVKRGDNVVEIAHDLGHRDATMVLKVYGKYAPKEAELRRRAVRIAR
jgi:site-specific recombinase XerC